MIDLYWKIRNWWMAWLHSDDRRSTYLTKRRNARVARRLAARGIDVTGYDREPSAEETAFLMSNPKTRKELLESILELEGKRGEWRLRNLKS